MSQENNSPKIEDFFRRYSPTVLFVSIFTVTVLEATRPSILTVTWETITLVGLLLLLPYVRNLKRVEVANVGGFQLQDDIEATKEALEELFEESTFEIEEASEDGPSDEIGEEQMDDENDERKEEQVQTPQDERWNFQNIAGDETYAVPRPSVSHNLSGPGGELSVISEEMYATLDKNPRLALVMLRKELDNGLLSIAEGSEVGLPIQEVMYRLTKRRAVGEAFVNAFRQVRNTCNEAVHGQDIPVGKATEIVDLGLSLLQYMNIQTKGDTIPSVVLKQTSIREFESKSND